jgi:predicted dehydrogenase
MGDMKQTERITRRRVLGAAASAAGVTILNARTLGRGGALPPSEKLNIAVIGTGGRGAISLQNLTGHNIVALCDADWRTERRDQFPAIKVAADYPGAKRYDDWRKMLDEMDKSIEAVVVACPDHNHAIASISAMKRGKHVYCEKPMAHSMEEVRAMAAAARKYKVTTQTGHQGHASDDVRSMVEWIRAGVIGTVKEVHIFEGQGGRPGMARAARAPKPSGAVQPPPADAPPAEVNWDAWIGPAPFRKYDPGLLTGRWRRWIDYGTGVLGDFNCHYFDPIQWALDLGLPDTIEATTDDSYDPRENKETYPGNVVVRYGFGAQGKRPAVTVTWYANSVQRPPLPAGWKEGDKLPDPTGGGIIVGTNGSILYGKIFHSLPDRPTPGVVRLFPDDLAKSSRLPDKTIPRVGGHWAEWVECSKAGGKQAGAHFGVSANITNIALLGNVAIRNKGKIMRVDTRRARFINDDEANKMLIFPSRSGWKLPT